jgi:putative acetyltransferase
MTLDTLIIRPERATDAPAIRALHSAAFGGATEADLVDALRNDGLVVLSLVAEEDGRIVGHVLYSRLAIEMGAALIPALALAPLAVAPARQRNDIGTRLVQEAHRLLAAQAEEMVFVVGDPGYYDRFGFSVAAAVPFETPYDGAYVMALALNPSAAKGGAVVYPPPFAHLG